MVRETVYICTKSEDCTFKVYRPNKPRYPNGSYIPNTCDAGGFCNYREAVEMEVWEHPHDRILRKKMEE